MLPKLAFRSCPLLHITFRIYLTFQMHLLFNVVMSSRSMQLLPAYKTEGTLSRLDFACDHMLRNNYFSTSGVPHNNSVEICGIHNVVQE